MVNHHLSSPINWLVNLYLQPVVKQPRVFHSSDVTVAQSSTALFASLRLGSFASWAMAWRENLRSRWYRLMEPHSINGVFLIFFWNVMSHKELFLPPSYFSNTYRKTSDISISLLPNYYYYCHFELWFWINKHDLIDGHWKMIFSMSYDLMRVAL